MGLKFAFLDVVRARVHPLNPFVDRNTKTKSPSGSRCGVNLADVVTIGGLDLGEQNAHRGDDASHDSTLR